MMVASEVAVATLASIATSQIRSGTITMPPPTPKSAEKNPARRPMPTRASVRWPASVPAVLASELMALAPEVATLLAQLRERPAGSALFLDFDGTLAPIVERPEEARLLDGVTPLLEELAGRMGLVAFLSGRPIGQLQAMVGLDQLAYAGNHGMELRRRGEEAAVADEAAAQVPAIQRFVHAWPPERLAANGVWLEDKGPTLAFHYRGAADPESAKAFLDTQVRPVAE